MAICPPDDLPSRACRRRAGDEGHGTARTDSRAGMVRGITASGTGNIRSRTGPHPSPLPISGRGRELAPRLLTSRPHFSTSRLLACSPPRLTERTPMTTRLDLRFALRRKLEDTGINPLWDDALLNDTLWNSLVRLGARIPLEASVSVPIPRTRPASPSRRRFRRSGCCG